MIEESDFLYDPDMPPKVDDGELFLGVPRVEYYRMQAVMDAATALAEHWRSHIVSGCDMAEQDLIAALSAAVAALSATAPTKPAETSWMPSAEPYVPDEDINEEPPAQRWGLFEDD